MSSCEVTMVLSVVLTITKAGFKVARFDRVIHPDMDILTKTGKIICTFARFFFGTACFHGMCCVLFFCLFVFWSFRPQKHHTAEAKRSSLAGSALLIMGQCLLLPFDTCFQLGSFILVVCSPCCMFFLLAYTCTSSAQAAPYLSGRQLRVCFCARWQCNCRLWVLLK